MSVAALYDIHGNLPALEAVLEEVEALGVSRIVVGGDVIPGPMPVGALQALLQLDLPVDVLYGNGETDVLNLMEGRGPVRFPAAFEETMRWTGQQLGVDLLERLSEWPATVRLHIDGLGEVLFCHATPRDDGEIFTERTPTEVLKPVLEVAGTVVCGHTHMQFDRTVGGTRVVNAGSVGMPFDEPGAYWALLGPTVELRRTEYNLEAAAARIRSTDYPGAAEFADSNVLKPPRRKEMLDVLERAALR
ncbi:MAG: metallophosphoesterase family protein [Longimicrobiales bacterium]